MNALQEKYEWVTTHSWERLHRVPDVVDYLKGGWKESFVNSCGVNLRSDCGLRALYVAPGVFSRMDLPRCVKCCKKVKISYGNGAPINDKSCGRTR